MQKINDTFRVHTTYSGTTSSGSITEGETMQRAKIKKAIRELKTMM